MSNQLIFTEELRAETVRLHPVVGAAVEEAMKTNGALPLDAFWVLVKTLAFTLEMMGHEEIADALILVFQRQLEWPRVPNTDAKIVLPIGEALYASLDIDAWVEDRFNENTLAYGRRAVVMVGVLIEIITDIVGQLWGPEKEQYIMGILEKTSEQSLIKVAKITLPSRNIREQAARKFGLADDAVSRRKQPGREKLMSNDMKRCGGWEEPCDKLATRIFEVQSRGEAGWHSVRLCDHHCRAFFEKNEKEGFCEMRFR